MKTWKFKFSLAYKVGLLIIAAVLITSLTLNFIFRGHYLRDEMEHIEERVMAISMLEAQHFAQNIIKNELQEMHEHLADHISAFKNPLDIHVYNKEGYLIVDKHGIQKNSRQIN
ncbi:MAG: hypothetical protein ACOYU2_08755 [Nitrospirota bacterium]